jgi:hypothetical protein
MPRFNPGLDHITGREPTATEINAWLDASDAYKRQEMKRYQARYGLETFVETGTFRGDTVEAMRYTFKEVYSIELDRGYYESLQRRFTGVANVHLLYGDSAVILPELLGAISKTNTLFWLDAHAGNPIRATTTPEQNYRGLVGVGKYDFSGLPELEYLLGQGLSNCVIMVDDIVAGGVGCLHGGCGCEQELMRIASHAELEMSVARVVCP